MLSVALATEDALSEAVGLRLIGGAGNDLEVVQKLRRGGSGYLRSSMRKFCELARIMPVVLITDLDNEECPATLIDVWARHDTVPKLLTFRVAVRQIESWLLGDAEGIAGFLKVNANSLPRNPDSLRDAKRHLLKLAQRSPRALRDELLAETGAIAAQGLGYNEVLSQFVRTGWDPSAAAGRSDSLARARRRLAEIAVQAGA